MFLLVSISFGSGKKKQDDDPLKQAIVKIYTTSKAPDYLEPWRSSMYRTSGSGAIIS
jgi:hypothetical protein